METSNDRVIQVHGEYPNRILVANYTLEYNPDLIKRIRRLVPINIHGEYFVDGNTGRRYFIPSLSWETEYVQQWESSW
jgi:hypothetical protein